MMIRMVAKLSRASMAVPRISNLASIAFNRPSLIAASPPLRLFHNALDGSVANPVTLQMINYALSHARSHKSAESYAQGLLVLEQCLSTQLSEGKDPETSRGMVLLAMSTLLSERGDFDDAIEKLRGVQELNSAFLGVRVAAIEALVGLHLELGQDDISSVLADKCLELIEKHEAGCSDKDFEALNVRANAVKGLVELVNGNLESAETFFQGLHHDKLCNASNAMSYGEFVHAKQNFSLAKEAYQKVIDGFSENENSGNPYVLAAGNMSLDGLMLGALCALGQLEAHLGNFGDAEELLTKALNRAEESYGSHHPKVGVVLTCIALMFRRKAVHERSSSLLIQEGLYRRATELLKAPPLETAGAMPLVDQGDIVALARGGYAEALGVQENRKAQGEKMRGSAEAIWRNRRLSLAEALEITDSSSKVPIIDARISRVL
ncbi:Tetratricopeptide repeat (TPR)-like superfamily protein, putative isoform 1 [Senna tora]|uniref:Tetratricopeptide repeat (TPR)-like superfamily protein, putative isoform 1 n=1 Tax=Senna tora TaxID=362788 RepID=A0A834TSF0_9FABA|nr:Tetratricopeptide repeat (TPR)-like superfamily protein, putative isoform 1 [Senna tora]